MISAVGSNDDDEDDDGGTNLEKLPVLLVRGTIRRGGEGKGLIVVVPILLTGTVGAIICTLVVF